MIPSLGSFRYSVYDDGSVAVVDELNIPFIALPSIFIPVILILVWSLL